MLELATNALFSPFWLAGLIWSHARDAFVLGQSYRVRRERDDFYSQPMYGKRVV